MPPSAKPSGCAGPETDKIAQQAADEVRRAAQSTQQEQVAAANQEKWKQREALALRVADVFEAPGQG